MAISFVEIKTSTLGSSVLSHSTGTGLAAGPATGDLIVVCARWSNEASVITWSDDDGGTNSDYTLIARQPLGGANSAECGMWYRVLSAPMAAGTIFTITSDVINNFALSASVYTGFTAASLDASNTGDTGSTPVASLAAGSITPSAADALLVTCATSRTDATWTVDSSYTERTEGGNGRLPVADRIVAASAAYNPTWTPDANEEMTAVHAAFVEASAPSVPDLTDQSSVFSAPPRGKPRASYFAPIAFVAIEVGGLTWQAIYPSVFVTTYEPTATGENG
jgi:hypothetical protein